MAQIHPRTALASLAMASAVVAFFMSPLLGFMLGLLAVIIGALAVLRAASSRRSGALMSVFAIALGVAAVVVKLLQGALRAIF